MSRARISALMVGIPLLKGSLLLKMPVAWRSKVKKGDGRSKVERVNGRSKVKRMDGWGVDSLRWLDVM